MAEAIPALAETLIPELAEEAGSAAEATETTPLLSDYDEVGNGQESAEQDIGNRSKGIKSFWSKLGSRIEHTWRSGPKQQLAEFRNYLHTGKWADPAVLPEQPRGSKLIEKINTTTSHVAAATGLGYAVAGGIDAGEKIANHIHKHLGTDDPKKVDTVYSGGGEQRNIPTGGPTNVNIYIHDTLRRHGVQPISGLPNRNETRKKTQDNIPQPVYPPSTTTIPQHETNYIPPYSASAFQGSLPAYYHYGFSKKTHRHRHERKKPSTRKRSSD